MSRHDNLHTRALAGLLLVSVLVVGCSRSEPPAPAATQPAPPAKGTVEGRIVGQKSAKPLAQQLVALCEVTSEPACTLRASLQATTGPEGTFVIPQVPPGRYTALYAPHSEKAMAKLQDGAQLDPTAVPVRVVGGSTVDILAADTRDVVTTNMSIGGSGLSIPRGNKLANIRGAVVNGDSGLTFEFREGKLAAFEVAAGAVARPDISAWAR